MARNVEIKTPVADLDALEERVAALARSGPEVIRQDDTFYPCPAGRLKLRTFADGRGELIAYRRPDTAGLRTSTYALAPVADAAGLGELLADTLGIAGRVRKVRRLYLAGPTRIHLDRVEGLGDFMELEVVLADGQPAGEGEAVARDLMQRLGIPEADLTAGAYVDLLAAAGSGEEG